MKPGFSEGGRHNTLPCSVPCSQCLLNAHTWDRVASCVYFQDVWVHQRRTAHVDVGTVQTSSFEVDKVALWVGLVQVT